MAALPMQVDNGTTHIIWDWNGTLLDDITLCLESVNAMLSKRGIKILEIEEYRRIFTFPVKDYYLSAGFDFEKEAFELLASEFVELYYTNFHKANLHSDSLLALEEVKSRGWQQSVLSAMESGALLDTLRQHQLIQFFTQISGLSDHHASSKYLAGQSLLEKIGHKNGNALLVGDTVHDHEVAKALGIPCVLVANGHQSMERLESSGRVVVKDLKEFIKHLDYEN